MQDVPPDTKGVADQQGGCAGPATSSRAPDNAGGGTTGTKHSREVQHLWEELNQKEAQLVILQRKLNHFRSWVSSVHAKIQQVNPQALKNSRRLYVGGVPTDVSDDELKQFMNGVMLKTRAVIAPGHAVLSCRITQEKSYAFVEFRSIEEASNAMAFDGVAFKDAYLKIRRPSNYDMSTALLLGPLLPDPSMELADLEICPTLVEDSPHKLFVGGLPCEWNEEQVKELLAPYGNLRSFNLVMDKVTGKSKGYAFCEYADDSITEFVIRNLNNKRLGNKMLTVKRALEGNRQHNGGRSSSLAHLVHGTHYPGMRMMMQREMEFGSIGGLQGSGAGPHIDSRPPATKAFYEQHHHQNYTHPSVPNSDSYPSNSRPDSSTEGSFTPSNNNQHDRHGEYSRGASKAGPLPPPHGVHSGMNGFNMISGVGHYWS